MTTTNFTRNDPKVISGWAFFDWANSAYSLTIAVAIFPAFFESVTNKTVSLFGVEMANTTLFAFAVAASYLIIACISPVLSGVADYSGRKKAFLKFFSTVGSLACLSMFFFNKTPGQEFVTEGQLVFGVAAFMLATIGFAGALVFYNSYLPDIATEDQYNRVSATGFAYGYTGSVILLVTNLLVILNPTWFGIAEGDNLAVRIAFLMVGLWWLGFAQVSFRRLPADRGGDFSTGLLGKGFGELRKVWRAVKSARNIRLFLLAFFFYSAGVQTVLNLAATFASGELGMKGEKLIFVILILQVLGLLGAYLFAKLSDWKGNKVTLMLMLGLWAIVCVAGYSVHTEMEFYLLAAAVGLVMGGVQSQSRATYSKLLPPETKDTASYFSFYDVLEKSATALGAFSFAFTGQLSGGMRASVLGLAVFFVAGLAVLSFVKIGRNDYHTERKK